MGSDVFLSLVRVFKDYDKDKTGTLNYEEFKQCLEEATGYEKILRKGEIPGGKTSIKLKEFLDIVMEDWPEVSVENEIKHSFQDIDTDNDNFITPEELTKHMEDKNLDIVNAKDVEAILKSADTNNDDKVSIDEFKAKMLDYVGMAGKST